MMFASTSARCRISSAACWTSPQLEIGRAGHVEEDALGALDARLQQGAGDRLTGRVDRPVLAAAATQADERRARVLHHRLTSAKSRLTTPSEVIMSMIPSTACSKHVVDDAECIEHRGVIGENATDTIIRDDDQGVDVGRELGGRCIGDLLPG